VENQEILSDNKLRALDKMKLRQIRAGIDDYINWTPCSFCEGLSEEYGVDIYLKLENLQRTGAFKIRGNAHKLSNLDEEKLKEGVITASSGNHGLGLSLSACLRTIPAAVLVPEGTPEIKIKKLNSYGAEVIVEGSTYDEAVGRAKKLAEDRDMMYISSFDDQDIILGNATIGWEIFTTLQEPAMVICPVGGGGGVSGVSLARNILSPGTDVVGVEAEGAASMTSSLARESRVELDNIETLADGIKVASPGRLTFSLVRDNVRDMINVSENDMQESFLKLMNKAKIVAELAGCAPVAALDKIDFSGVSGPVVCLISGGNIDHQLIGKILKNNLL